MAKPQVIVEYPNKPRSVQIESVTERPDNGFPTIASTSTAEEASGPNYKLPHIRGGSYDKFLDELGFGDDVDKRAEFVDKLYDHVDGSVFRYLRQHENPENFEKMVRDFLEKYGEIYWGATGRGHLFEHDTEKAFLCSRDASNPRSRLVVLLTTMFDYKARMLCANDSAKDESNRIRPYINVAALTWPAKDDAFVKFKENGRYRVQMLDRGLDEPGLQYPVAMNRWKSKTRKRKRPFDNSDSDYDPAPPSPISVSIPPCDPELERFIVTQIERFDAIRATVTKSRRKSQPSVLSQEQESPVPLSTPPANPELGRVSRSNIIGDALRPTVRSTLSSMQGQAQESDDDFLILDRAPPSWKARDNIKEETVAIKEEPLAVEVTRGTRLVVSASNQTGMAPVNISLGSIATIDQLYHKLATACELRPGESQKITTVSVTYTWSGEQQRLRKDHAEDLKLFKEILGKAWERNSARFDEGCKVNMMLHVGV